MRCPCGWWLSNQQKSPTMAGSEWVYLETERMGSMSLTALQVCTHTRVTRTQKKGTKQTGITDLEKEEGQCAHRGASIHQMFLVGCAKSEEMASYRHSS